ncbi:hypothetical protein EX30DRAFT_338251 [Ascodesmis nigricans]|uniref:Uncharacterized protein n=1 Tax=Ascodesmis nigricans TaxID=341454 RepID=A0A4V6RHH5_9PEZI|nr:hypothetical protein EX30DRAFT_338251 [Ascodesmis nigricans]
MDNHPQDRPLNEAPLPRAVKVRPSSFSTAGAANMSLMREKFERIYHASPVPRAIARAMTSLPNHHTPTVTAEHLSDIMPSPADLQHNSFLSAPNKETQLWAGPRESATVITDQTKPLLPTPGTTPVIRTGDIRQSRPQSLSTDSQSPPKSPVRPPHPKENVEPECIPSPTIDTGEGCPELTVENPAKEGRENGIITAAKASVKSHKFEVVVKTDHRRSESLANARTPPNKRRKTTSSSASTVHKNNTKSYTSLQAPRTNKRPSGTQLSIPTPPKDDPLPSAPNKSRVTAPSADHQSKKSTRTRRTVPSMNAETTNESSTRRRKHTKAQEPEAVKTQVKKLAVNKVTSNTRNTSNPASKGMLLDGLKFGKEHIPPDVLESTGSSWESGRRHSRRHTIGSQEVRKLTNTSKATTSQKVKTSRSSLGGNGREKLEKPGKRANPQHDFSDEDLDS